MSYILATVKPLPGTVDTDVADLAGDSVVGTVDEGAVVCTDTSNVAGDIAVGTIEAGNSISVSIVASRTAGPGPLTVHFDATGTTSTNTTRHWLELDFKWDFGDPTPPAGLENWSYGNQDRNSRNVDYGHVAVHTFDPTGDSLPPASDTVYTVTLTVTDKQGNTAQETLQVTVQTDANAGITNLVCMATDNDFTGAPSLTDPRWGSVTHASNQTGQNLNGQLSDNTRVLMHAAQNFQCTGQQNLNYSNVRIGRFGSGADPIFSRDGAFVMFQFGQFTTNLGDDDLAFLQCEFECANTAAYLFRTWAFGAFTVYRCRTTNTNAVCVGYTWGNLVGEGLSASDICRTFFVDCDFAESNSDNQNPQYKFFGIWNSGGNMGCRWGSPRSGSHTLRHQYSERCVIGHCETHPPAPASGPDSRNPLRIHAPTDGSTENQYTLVTACVFPHDVYSAGQLIQIGPQNSSSDERVSRAVVDACLCYSTRNLGSNRQVWIAARDCCVRNCKLWVALGSDDGIEIDQRGVEPAPLGNVVEYCSYFSQNNGVGLRIAANATDTEVYNLITDSSAGSAIVDNGTNTTALGNALIDEVWASTPSDPAAGNEDDMNLDGTSLSIDAGVTNAYALRDYAGNLRPLGAANDRGAQERA